MRVVERGDGDALEPCRALGRHHTLHPEGRLDLHQVLLRRPHRSTLLDDVLVAGVTVSTTLRRRGGAA